jgi:AcrR family transcriptional regulator
MARPKRSQKHPNLQAAIKEVARKQITEHGATSLSLRAIARELGITAPAIYNYYPSRDDLVTVLIVDTYHSFAVALTQARDAEQGNHAERILATARAYRDWALAQPEEYSLILGTPIPGYHAPMEITGPAVAESMIVFLQVLDAAYQDGELLINKPPPALNTMLQPWIEKLGFTGPPAIIHFALASWAHLHGLVSLELFGHLAPTPEYGSVDALFEIEIQAMVAQMGIG